MLFFKKKSKEYSREPPASLRSPAGVGVSGGGNESAALMLPRQSEGGGAGGPNEDGDDTSLGKCQDVFKYIVNF